MRLRFCIYYSSFRPLLSTCAVLRTVMIRAETAAAERIFVGLQQRLIYQITDDIMEVTKDIPKIPGLQPAVNPRA